MASTMIHAAGKCLAAAVLAAVLGISAHAQTGTAPSQPGGAPSPGVSPATPAPAGTTGTSSGMTGGATAPSPTRPGTPGAVSPGNPDAASRPSVPNIGGAPIVTQPGRP